MRIQAGTPWLADGYRFKLFEDESLKEAALKPSDKDNFILHPKDDQKTFLEFSVGGQSADASPRPSASQRRIKSASSVRLQDRPWRKQTAPRNYPAGFVPRSRPTSAVPQKSRPLSGSVPSQRRIKSAGSNRTQTEQRAQEVVDELRKGFSLVNKLYENDYRSSHISLHPASPAPDYRYFDRHSRCYNHTHAHQRVMNDRPQKACEKFLECCGSRANSPARGSDPHGQPQRYIDYHRPRTAPGTRRELQYIPRPSYVYRGHAPHFCNFVQQVPLHSKQASATDSTGLPDSELDDDIEFITETAEGRMINKWRKNSGTSSIPETKEDGLNSGTEGRPGSPSSLDGTEVRLDDDPSSRPVTGIEVRVSSPVKSETGSQKKVVPVSDEIKETTKDMIGSGVGRNSTIPEEDIVLPDQPAKAWDDGKSQKSADSLLILNNVDNNNINGNGRPQSPRQPPPSPEPTLRATKTPEPPPSTSRKRSCVNKKTKKPIERVRKMKEPEPAPKEPDPPVGEETDGVAPPVVESDKVDAKVDLKVPDLPSTNEDKKSKKKEKSKPKKHLIEAEDDLFKADPTDVLNDQMKQNRTEVDWSNMDTNGMDDVKRPPQIKSWIQGRLALSQQSSRFELPMDMKLLESMTPQEYIRKYCIITSRRQNLYSKIFLKNKDKSQVILFKDLDKTLKDVLVHTITSEQVQDILKTFEIDENTKVDYKLFAGISAFAERVLYPKYVTEDTVYMPEYQKEKIECADFCALDWKFHGVKVNPTMQNLLMQLR